MPRLITFGVLDAFLLVTTLGPAALTDQAQTRPIATPALTAGTDSPQQQAPPSTTSGSDRSIPLTQIADRAEELERWLRGITSQLTPEGELLGAEAEAKNESQWVRENVNQVNDLLMNNPTVLELQREQRFWRILNEKYAGEREGLTPRAALLEQQISHADETNLDWQATWDHFHQNQEIKSVVDRIAQELELIRKARADLQNQLNLLLTLQAEISEMHRHTSDLLAKVQDAQAQTRSRLFKPDSAPVWKVLEIGTLDQAFQAGIRRTFDLSLITFMIFLQEQKVGIISTLACYLLALIGTLWVRRWLARGREASIPNAAAKIFAFPFSLALLIALVLTIFYISYAPFDIAFVIWALYLIPVLRLLSPLLEPRLRTLFYGVGAFYMLELLYLLMRFTPLVQREFHSLIVLGALIWFGWFGRPTRLNEPSISRASQQALKLAIWLGLVLLTCSLVANILGFMSLAQIAGITALLGAFVATALFCAARVLTLILSTVLRTNWAQSVLESRTEAVDRWAWRILTLGSVYLWFNVLSRLLTLHDILTRVVSDALAYPIGFQKVHFTFGGLFSFLFILFAGYAIANAITFAFRKFLLSRIPLARGLPFAISKITYYVLLVLVSVAGLANAGLDVNRLTLVTGALGVGVGFGLQNIFNNFVSGLILLIERPIRVGDTVEIGGVVGRVRRIGARSSTVHTFQDSEVIVPNSDFVAKEVINWTLSSLRRRVDIPLSVAYGTEPERLISLLLELAVTHPAVISNPKPEAYFLGFGESALRFELRFWTYQEDWFQLKSDIAVHLITALREANIEIPFPQRDLHIRSVNSLHPQLVPSGIARLP